MSIHVSWDPSLLQVPAHLGEPQTTHFAGIVVESIEHAQSEVYAGRCYTKGGV